MIFESEAENKARRPFNTKGKDWVVDTAYTSDTGYFETGIKSERLNSETWIIVEQYENKKEAEKGHRKWVKYIKTNPKRLYDIFKDEWLK